MKSEENAGGKKKPEPGWRQEVGETCWSGPLGPTYAQFLRLGKPDNKAILAAFYS
jgi:hypothetical protein